MEKKIVFDARYFGMSGIGTFCKGLLDNLSSEELSSLVLIGNKEKLSDLYPSAQIIDNQTNPFSKGGLFFSKSLLKQINSESAFFSPAYILPFGIKIPVYSTIHDCVFFDEPETCKSMLDKKIKKYFYKRATKHSKIIFTVSQFSKNRILDLFNCLENNVVVISTGLSKDILQYKEENKEKKKTDSFVYVGNFKSHKGIDTLLKAFEIYRKQGGKNKLFIVGSKENLNTYVSTNSWSTLQGVEVKEHLSNEDLFDLISSASALVQPSRYEGFGLPPLEAMYLGTPVILNDIPVFQEVYGFSEATFFKTNDFEDLAKKLTCYNNKVDFEKFFPQNGFILSKRTILEKINASLLIQNK